MPKIFLIKNRLHQQQQGLLEAQHLSKSPPPGSGKDSPLGSSEPLSLIVNKHQCKSPESYFSDKIISPASTDFRSSRSIFQRPRT